MKKRSFQYIISVLSFALIVVQTGCNKQLDINQNPNNPTLEQGNPKLVFPAAVLATAGKVGAILRYSVVSGDSILHSPPFPININLLMRMM
jgi:hypothetical protein